MSQTDKSPPAPPPGDSDQAMRQALTELAPKVRRYFFGLCGQWDRSEDLAQVVLTRAWQRRAQFDGRSQIGTWVYAIARNCWRDELRRKPRPEQPMDETIGYPDPRPGPTHDVGRAELAAALAGAMDRLPAPQREALALRESEGLSFPQIAQVLGVPVATVKSRVRYALMKLADELAPYQPEGQA